MADTLEKKKAQAKLLLARRKRDQIKLAKKEIARRKKESNATSGTDAFVSGAGQGLSAGFGDEMYGAKRTLDAVGDNVATAAGNLFRGKENKKSYRSLSDTYTQNRDMARAYNSAAQDEHPVAFGTGYVGGAVGGTLLAAPLSGGLKLAEGASIGSQIARGAAIGAGDTALHEVGNAQGGLSNRIKSIDPASVALGAGLGGVAPGVVAGAKAVSKSEGLIGRFLRHEGGAPAPKVDKLTDAEGLVAEAATRSSVKDIPTSVADESRTIGQTLAGEAQKGTIDNQAASEWIGLAQHAAKASPEVAGDLRGGILGSRGAAATKKLNETVDSATETGSKYGDEVRRARNNARAEASDKAYEEFRSGPLDPGVFQQKVLPLLTNPVFSDPLKKVLDRTNVLALAGKMAGTKGAAQLEASADSVRALIKGLEEDLPLGSVTPQALDEVQRVLGSMRDAAMRGAEPDTHLAGVLGSLRKTFIDQTDLATGGRMKKALDAYRIPSAINDIEDLASGVISGGKLNPSEFADEVARLGQVLPKGEAQAAAKQGLANALRAELRTRTGNADEMNAMVRKLKGMSRDNDTYRMVEGILGKDKAGSFFDSMNNTARDFNYDAEVLRGTPGSGAGGKLAPSTLGDAITNSPLTFSMTYSALRLSKNLMGGIITVSNEKQARVVAGEVADLVGAASTPENLAKIAKIVSRAQKSIARVKNPNPSALDLAYKRIARDLRAADLTAAGGGALAGSGQEQ